MKNNVLKLTTLIAVIGSLMVPLTANAPPLTCNGFTATIIGTDGDDILLGTLGNDVIVALGGDDDIHSRAGDDVVCAGAGHDEIFAWEGNDFVDAGTGNDHIISYSGNDVAYGGEGCDEIGGGPDAENTTLVDDDIVYGFYPDDYTPDWHSLVPTTHPGSRSPANMTGGDKNDEVHGSNYGNDRVFGDGGDDRLFGHWGDDRVVAGRGDDFADGGADSDGDSCLAEEVINCLSSGEVIIPIVTSITLDLPSEVNITETVKITASILEFSGNAARNVTIDFYDSTTLIGSNRSDTLGMTSISYTPVAGAHPIKAELMANEHYEASESPVRILNVIDPSVTGTECNGITSTIIGRGR